MNLEDDLNPELLQLRDQVNLLASERDAATRRTAFYEAAQQQGVRNLRLAFHAFAEDPVTDETGAPDWETFRSRFPELFFAAGPAGAGRGWDEVPTEVDMNRWIRRAAGR